ncbi:hypothetical protein RAHE111665_16045 [Rariglobus hedericola]
MSQTFLGRAHKPFTGFAAYPKFAGIDAGPAGMPDNRFTRIEIAPLVTATAGLLASADLFERLNENGNTQPTPRYPCIGPRPRKSPSVSYLLIRCQRARSFDAASGVELIPATVTSLNFYPMKTVTHRLRSLLLSVVVIALLPLGAMAEGKLAVFSPKDGFADGWKASAWSGPTTGEIPGTEKGTSILQVSVSADTKPYAGLILTSTAGSGFALSEKALKSGEVLINLKPGKTALGAAATVAQPLQLALTFLTKTGETVHGGFSTMANVLETSPASGSQLVKIAVANSLTGLKVTPDQLASISGVRFQYAGEALAGFLIIDCVIKE